MRVLLSGATGFLGSHLVKGLLAQGDHVAAYRRAESNLERLETEKNRVEWFDIQNEIALPFDAPVDAIIHAATSYGRRGERVNDLLRSNVLFPLDVHWLAREHQVPFFLNMHTALSSEVSPYAQSKQQVAEWLDRDDPLPKVVHLEMEHFYGPDDDSYKFMGWLLNQCQRNEPRIELTEGVQRRDFFHIRDAVSAILHVLDHQDRLRHRQRIEVGSGHSIPIREIVEKIHRLSGSTSQLIFGAKAARLGEPADSKADLQFLSELGWKPSISLDEGLAELCHYFNQTEKIKK